MYDKYFNDKLIDKALLSDEYTDETIDSYMFRIINLHNKNTQLSSLKGLRAIYRLVGLNTISRLTNSKESFNVALAMFNIILKNLNQPTDIDNQQTPQNENGEGSSSDEQGSDDGQGGSSNEGMSDDEFNELLESIGESPMGGDSDESPTGGNGMDVGNLPDNMDGGKDRKSVV